MKSPFSALTHPSTSDTHMQRLSFNPGLSNLVADIYASLSSINVLATRPGTELSFECECECLRVRISFAIHLAYLGECVCGRACVLTLIACVLLTVVRTSLMAVRF